MNKVESKILIRELETDGHSPMMFICSDGEVYYVKFKSGKSFDRSEINCLVFEMICTYLLQKLKIPVPDQAFVTIAEHSYVKNQLIVNKRYTKPGVIAWGSKQILQTDLVKEIEQIQSKKDFNKIANPEDLIKIAIFDIWVDNMDRHGGNYNLLLKLNESKLNIIAIDHAFAFGGLKGMNIFNAHTEPNSYKKLIESQYFSSIIKHFTIKQRLQIANEFLSLIDKIDVEHLINEVFDEIPEIWEINSNLKKRVIDFLQSKYRCLALGQIVKHRLQKNQRRI